MRHKIRMYDRCAVFYSFRDANFAEMLELLPSSEWIDIATFNISKRDRTLQRLLAKECKGIPVRFVTKIPNWFETYGAYQRTTFKETFDIYHAALDPARYECKFEAFFNVHNHSKLILTNRAAYVGSANFSVESANNHECGVVFYGPDAIRTIRKDVFEPLLLASYPRDVSELGLAKLYFQQFADSIPDVFAPLDDGLFAPNDDPISGLRGFDVLFRGTDAEIPDGALAQVIRYLDQLDKDFDGFRNHPRLSVVATLLPEEELADLRRGVSDENGVFAQLAAFRLDAATDKHMAKHSEQWYAFNTDACAERASNDAQAEYEEIISGVHDEYRRLQEQMATKTTALLKELDRLEKTTWGVDNS